MPASWAMVRREASVYPFSRNSFFAQASTASYTPSICFAMDGPPFQRFKTVFYNTVLIIGQMGNAVNTNLAGNSSNTIAEDTEL
ncbi:hypothetical protein K150096H7_08230 [[Clostridium] symbiosum]